MTKLQRQRPANKWNGDFSTVTQLHNAYDVQSMKSSGATRGVALGASLPLSVLAAWIAWRSIERLYAAYQIAQGRIPTDDLMQAHINLQLEMAAWGIVIGIVLVVSFLLGFCRRSGRSNRQQLT